MAGLFMALLVPPPKPGSAEGGVGPLYIPSVPVDIFSLSRLFSSGQRGMLDYRMVVTTPAQGKLFKFAVAERWSRALRRRP